jgi:RND family efflux transporter MFP subunit
MAKLLKAILPILILIIGAGSGLWFLSNPQEAKKGPKPEAKALLVETRSPEFGSFITKISAMGQVTPAIQTSINSQISGEITKVSAEYIPGGRFQAEEIVIEVDPRDYELTVKQKQAELTQAKAEYKLEQGRQEIAREEMALLTRTTGKTLNSTDLALRKPQLAQAKAEIDRAQAELEIARLGLERTKIKAPFNALLIEKYVDLGDRVSPGTAIAKLVSLDEYWVEISLAIDDLKWLQPASLVKNSANSARIIDSQGNYTREGALIRVSGALDNGSRLARAIVSFKNPDSENLNPLILGDYVKIEVDGKLLEDVIRIPSKWIRDQGHIWLNNNGRLETKKLSILHEDSSFAYISEGLTKQDEIIISEISVPVEGMKIRTMNEVRSDVREKMKGLKGPNNKTK